MTTWVLSVIGLGLLLIDLAGGLIDDGNGAGPDGTPRDLLAYGLVPDWYDIVNSVPGVVTLGLMVAGALALARSGVADYYREASWRKDDRWAAFVTDQKGRIADGS